LRWVTAGFSEGFYISEYHRNKNDSFTLAPLARMGFTGVRTDK